MFRKESVKAVLPRQRELPESTTSVRNDQIEEFLQYLNKQNAYAGNQFTKEMEENGKIHSLDCLITRDKNCSRTAVYRRSTHSDRLLDQTSYNPTTPHKATTTRALTKRVQTVGDSNDSLANESTYLNNVFNLRKTTIPTILL